LILGRRKSLENLKPINTRTPAERSKIASQGGKASGKARKKKADLKQAMEIILAADVSSEKAKDTLESLGLDPTNEMLLAFQMFQQAANGNVRAFEAITKVTNVKDKYDIAEQKARTKLITQQAKAAEAELKTSTSQEDKIAELFDIVDGEINESK
jgi:hypothetical protein